MNQGKKTVVPFERPAAYWAVRARRHYHPEQLPDAARFMRKALEKSGDTGLALELAQIYSAMGCYTAAERCLLRLRADRHTVETVTTLVKHHDTPLPEDPRLLKRRWIF